MTDDPFLPSFQASSDTSSDTVPLELEGIAHRFGRRWVLRGIDLRIGTGEVLALMGTNGAGKTTLLRIAATLLHPTRGRGRVHGQDLAREADRIRERVAFLGHSPALYEDLTPEENLRFALRMRGLEAEPETIEAVLREVALQAHATTPVRRFSTGMRRRVALGRILAAPPRLLVMDEPYASLDRGGVELVNRIIEGVRTRGGAVLLATHDPRSGAGVADRTLLLQRGVLVRAEATPPHADAGTRTSGGGLPAR
jgi:heme exporter protein A